MIRVSIGVDSKKSAVIATGLVLRIGDVSCGTDCKRSRLFTLVLFLSVSFPVLITCIVSLAASFLIPT